MTMNATRPAEPEYADALRALLVAPVHGTMTDAVTDALREAILSGVIAAPTWLREDEIARALDVSRTPVREALRRLADEGLAQRQANRGTVVAPMTMEQILAVYAVRESLEGLAARTVAEQRPAGLVEQLREIQARTVEQSGDHRAVAALNIEFHAAIRDAAGNPYLSRFLTQVEHAVRRFGDTTFAMAGRTGHALDEHEAIIDAIERGDADLAERRSIDHMRNARETRIRQMLGR